VLRPRKAIRAFWQKWSSWLWRCPSETTSNSAQEWTNRTPNTTNLSIFCCLVLPGESTIIEITAYLYFSRIWSDCELQHKIEQHFVPLRIINGLIPFLWNMFTTHQTVRGQQQCDFSILGRLATSVMTSVRHWTRLQSILPSRMGRIKLKYKMFECLLNGTLN